MSNPSEELADLQQLTERLERHIPDDCDVQPNYRQGGPDHTNGRITIHVPLADEEDDE